jgi:FAD/FMN-containing dehydrogenase
MCIYIQSKIIYLTTGGILRDKKITQNIEKQLSDIVGPNRVSWDIADLIPFERDDQCPIVPPHLPDYVVQPTTREEIQDILRLANRERIPVVPLSAGINRKGLCIPSKGGILLDLRRMNRISDIDEDMMTATIEPGVTFVQLVEALRGTGLRAITPDAPATVSVLANYMLRGIYGSATRYGIDHLLTIEVVLPNGDVLETGSAATPNGIPYCGIVNGPDFCKIFQGSPGNLGVITEARIRLYPMPEEIRVKIAMYPTMESMVDPAIQFAKEDLVAGMWAMSFSPKIIPMIMGLLMPDTSFGIPSTRDFFGMVLFLEGSKVRVDADEKTIKKILKSTGGRLMPISSDTMVKDHLCMRSAVIGWRAGNLYGCSFYGMMKLVPQYYKVCSEVCKKYDLGALHYEAMPVSPFHGQLTYNDPCIFWDASDPDQVERMVKLNRELIKRLLDVGIYGWFRAFPGVVDASVLGKYGEFWRDIKRFIDPNNIMNPGKPPEVLE